MDRDVTDRPYLAVVAVSESTAEAVEGGKYNLYANLTGGDGPGRTATVGIPVDVILTPDEVDALIVNQPLAAEGTKEPHRSARAKLRIMGEGRSAA